MLNETSTFSSFSVHDIDEAKQFYGDKLGLDTSVNEMGTLELHLKGGNEVIAYPKGDAHQAANFTVLNFTVNNIDDAVEFLVSIGIKMEQYEYPKTDKRGIFRSSNKNEGPNIAWFKDPSGNILSVIEE
ncbi:VOC family protein [Galbibacter pacificus]|uniref:VOC family protein n=1 Tax=Galbibacter pacificus TaxID=2996052 RepID=A0ABT6FUR6_9FLAO|nr:VOC family protein [Galbibacter pacificus]MDG3583506.1 VOC family protein [Galbibacter pacificus]MDG3587018.1 VOC family protein [Galbibacter pacificus]